MRKQLKAKYYAQKMTELQGEHPKKWWQLIKDITGQKKGTNQLQGLANSCAGGNMACLADKISLSLQAVTSDMQPLETVTRPAVQEHIPSDYIIPVEQVATQLSKIKVNKAVGPDLIPNWLLRDMAQELAPVICAIWNSSFRESFVPQLWKSADIVNIPKVTPPVHIDKDLRPISLTPTLSKGIEHHARKWLGQWLDPALDPHQFGSRSKYSTVTALTHLIHSWLLELERSGTVVRTLLIDYRKAFDRVDHNILIDKMKNLGLPTFLVDWYSDFLRDRKQRVKIGDTTSEWASVCAGVPQGTLTGPTSFLLHINDLQTACAHVKYVDDTSLWESCNISGSDSKLQQAADQVNVWTSRNKMQLNTGKTKEMTIYFGRKKTSINRITINNQQIETVNTFKLLGVILNDKLTWDDHVHYIVGKAAKRLYFLRLLKRANVPSEQIIRVYESTVRSVLEYAAEVWHPGLSQTHAQQIEHIQKRALRIALPTHDYSSALSSTNMLTLNERREEICRNWFTNICNTSHPLNHLLPEKRTNTRLRKSVAYAIPKVRTDRLKKSPLYYGLFKFQ